MKAPTIDDKLKKCKLMLKAPTSDLIIVLSLGNFCTIAKISGEFAKALKMTFFSLKTIYIFIIHTKE